MQFMAHITFIHSLEVHCGAETTLKRLENGHIMLNRGKVLCLHYDQAVRNQYCKEILQTRIVFVEYGTVNF